MSNDENTDLLIGLGLTLNQARVYLAVLKLEKTTVGQVAKYSKVRREDVYRVLPSLEEMGLVERLLGKPAELRATLVTDALTSLVEEEKKRSAERLMGMESKVKKLTLKEWKQPPLEESIYILIGEKKAILAKTSELIKNSKKEVAFITDKEHFRPILAYFKDECKKAINKESQIRLILEGDDGSDVSLKKSVEKSIGSVLVSVKFHREPLNHFIMSDDKEALITTSKESGLGESPSLWTNNRNLIGVLRTGFESDWKKAEN